MPKQFVSICGMSAAGKKHLIERLIKGDEGLKRRFGFDGEIGVYGEHEKSRIALKPSEQMLTAVEDCVLFFWQFRTHPWIAHLLQEFPKARHRVILLWRPWNINKLALLDPERDPQWRTDEAGLKWVWKNQIVPSFKEIAVTGVELELVDASTPGYNVMAWPDA